MVAYLEGLQASERHWSQASRHMLGLVERRQGRTALAPGVVGPQDEDAGADGGVAAGACGGAGERDRGLKSRRSRTPTLSCCAQSQHPRVAGPLRTARIARDSGTARHHVGPATSRRVTRSS